MNKSAELRCMLASVGIFIDEPVVKPVALVVTRQRDEVAELLTRESIREILIAAGAPARDLEWLVASCPGVDSARRYAPPACEDA